MAENFLSNHHQHAQSLWGFSNLPTALRLQAGESYAEQCEKDRQRRREKKEKRAINYLRRQKAATKAASKTKSPAGDTVQSVYVNDENANSYERTIAAAANAENERIDTIIMAESAGLKLSETGNYVSPNICELYVARMLHEHDILELYFVNDRWMTRVHRSVILLARVSIKVTVVGTFFIIKETSNGFWDQAIAIGLGFLANKIWGGFVKTLFVLLTTRRRAMALNCYIGASRSARKHPGKVPQHERRDLQRKIVRLEIERELQEERHWCLSMLASVCGCEAKCCARLPRRAGRCMDCAACAVWLLVFAMIGFCLFFGVMFGFAIEDPAMTAAWLESVMFSIGFWIFCSRPAAIFAKTLIRRGKLARTAARVQAKRKHHAERRLLLLKSLQQQGVTVTPPSTMHSKMETDLVEMFQDEYRMYEHYSADIVSPKGRERFSGMQAAISL